MLPQLFSKHIGKLIGGGDSSPTGTGSALTYVPRLHNVRHLECWTLR
jgi:hypothetical protein